MKILYTLLIIFFVSSQGNAKTTPTDAFITFFNQLELNEIPIATLAIYKDSLKIKDLVLEIINDLEHSRNWAQIANSVSKVGKVFNLAAGDIVKLANDTKLIEQTDLILNKFNEITKDPGLYFSKVLNNIKGNPVLIAWSLFDVYSLLKVESYNEFGKRLANMLLLIFEGKPIPTPPRNLRDLSLKFTKAKQYENYENCFNKGVNYFNEIKSLINADVNILKIFLSSVNFFKDISQCIIES